MICTWELILTQKAIINGLIFQSKISNFKEKSDLISLTLQRKPHSIIKEWELMFYQWSKNNSNKTKEKS